MKLICIEGVDGVGKSTQSKLLAEYLEGTGCHAGYFHFPDYDSVSGQHIRQYLDGLQPTLNVYHASLLYAVNRADWVSSTDLSEYDYIVADRFIGSNLIHQMSCLPEVTWEDYVDWCFQLEFGRLGIPVPAITIALSLPQKISQRLLSSRSELDTIESDTSRTSRSIAALEWLSSYLGWHQIACNQQDDIFPSDIIHNLVIQCLRTNHIL